MAEELPDIEAIESSLKTTWAERDRLIEELRAIRFMENEPDIPTELEAEIVRTPIAYSIIERVVGMLTADPIGITVPPASETDKAQEASSKMEKWTHAALNRLQDQTDDDVIDRFVECLVADGHGCMRMLHAPQLWKGYPRRSKNQEDEEYNKSTEEWKKGRSIPISFAWVDPLNVYPAWDEFGLAYVLETDRRNLSLLNKERFNVAKEQPDIWTLIREKSGDTADVSFQQLWTRDTLTYAVEGEIVHHQKHKYGSPPYVYSFGQGISTRDPGKMGMSLLYPLRFLLPYLDRLLSQKGTAIRLWCWPTPVLKQSVQLSVTGPEGGPAPLRSLEVVPGKLVSLYPDEELTFLVWEGNGPDADEMVSLIMTMIERAGLADVLYGQGSTGDSGYLVNQLIAAARMKLKPLVAHANRSIQAMIRCLWDIVEYQIKQTVYVYETGKGRGWIGIGPDDLGGYRQVEVTLNPIMPVDAYARSSQAINELRAGLRSRRSAMEMIGIEQPDEEEQRILVDQWKQSPQVQQLLVNEAIKRAGLKLQEPEPGPAQVLQQLPGMPPALQQVAQQQLGSQPPPEAEGMPGAGGVPPEIVAVVQQGLSQGVPPTHVAAALLSQGVPPEVVMQALVQAGLEPQIAQAAVQQAMQMLQAGEQGGMPGGVGQPGPNVRGMPQAAVEAAPGVQAAPGAPPPQAGAGIPAPTAGRQVRPSGVATGRAPGKKMRGMESRR